MKDMTDCTYCQGSGRRMYIDMKTMKPVNMDCKVKPSTWETEEVERWISNDENALHRWGQMQTNGARRRLAQNAMGEYSKGFDWSLVNWDEVNETLSEVTP